MLVKSGMQRKKSGQGRLKKEKLRSKRNAQLVIQIQNWIPSAHSNEGGDTININGCDADVLVTSSDRIVAQK